MALELRNCAGTSGYGACAGVGLPDATGRVLLKTYLIWIRSRQFSSYVWVVRDHVKESHVVSDGVLQGNDEWGARAADERWTPAKPPPKLSVRASSLCVPNTSQQPTPDSIPHAPHSSVKRVSVIIAMSFRGVWMNAESARHPPIWQIRHPAGGPRFTIPSVLIQLNPRHYSATSPRARSL